MALFKSIWILALIAFAYCSATKLYSNNLADEAENRLINANWANEDQFPYHVAITSNSVIDGTLTLCSGSILSLSLRLWVLTSASCVFYSSNFQIRSNAVTYYTGGQFQVSDEAIIHPLYDPVNRDNDVALIPITLPRFFRPISLLPANLANWDFSGRLGVVSGWGLSRSQQISPVLQFSNANILNNSHPNCVNNWNLSRPQSSILCATVFRQYSCSGDSGSPLAIQVNRTWFLVGVAVFPASENVCQNSTSLFTPISSIREWISNVTLNLF